MIQKVYNFSSKARGFTLIELLVVIAIIGILAGIVLAALGTTRQKGADAGIQGNLDSIRTGAEVFAGNNSNTYGTAQAAAAVAAGNSCGSTVGSMWVDPTIAAATKAASNNAGTPVALGGGVNTVACVSTPTFYLITAVLKTNPLMALCVDSTGVAKQSTGTNMDTLAKITALTGCPN